LISQPLTEFKFWTSK